MKYWKPRRLIGEFVESLQQISTFAVCAFLSSARADELVGLAEVVTIADNAQALAKSATGVAVERSHEGYEPSQRRSGFHS